LGYVGLVVVAPGDHVAIRQIEVAVRTGEPVNADPMGSISTPAQRARRLFPALIPKYLDYPGAIPGQVLKC